MWDWDEFALNTTSATEVERASARLRSWGAARRLGMGLPSSTHMGKLVMGWCGGALSSSKAPGADHVPKSTKKEKIKRKIAFPYTPLNFTGGGEAPG